MPNTDVRSGRRRSLRNRNLLCLQVRFTGIYRPYNPKNSSFLHQLPPIFFKALSHQASQLAVPQIQWLGLKPSHTTLLDLKLLPLTPRDQSRIRELLRRPYIGQRGCLLERELNLMRELNGKAEIESLTDISVDYLLNEYLPNQLQLIST